VSNARQDGADAGRTVQEATKDEEAREALASHTGDRPLMPDEEAAADGNQLDPESPSTNGRWTRSGLRSRAKARSTEPGRPGLSGAYR
jgi:hypothetical protein